MHTVLVKSSITAISKTHGVLRSHRRNFTIETTITKQFASVFNEYGWSWSQASLVKNDNKNDNKYRQKKLAVRPKTCLKKTKREKKKTTANLVALHANVVTKLIDLKNIHSIKCKNIRFARLVWYMPKLKVC